MEPCGAAGAGGFSAAGAFFNFLFFFSGAPGVPGAFLFGAAILPRKADGKDHACTCSHGKHRGVSGSTEHM